MKHHHIRPAGGQNFETAGVGRVHQTPLALDDNHLGLGLFPGGPHSVFYLSSDEVVDKGVEDEAVTNPLHPGGLPGTDEFCAICGLTETIKENPSGGAFADRGIRTQHCHF